MRNLIGAPVAALFMVLIAVALIPSRGSTGQAVQIAAPGATCGDGRIIVADVVDSGHVKLNLETVDVTNLAARLHEVYDVRAVRVLFIKAAPELPFQNVAEVIDIAKRQIEVVAILTPSVEGQPCWLIRPPTPIEWISTGRQPRTHY